MSHGTVRAAAVVCGLTLIAVAAACEGAAGGAGDAGGPGRDAVGDGLGGCCPRSPAPGNCDCVWLGGSPDLPPIVGRCGGVCDMVVAGWTLRTDEHGCPYWEPIPGGTECVGRPDAVGGGADGDAGAGAECCPIAPDPSCDCAEMGGAPDQPGGCHAVCDAAPQGWELVTDGHGCPMWLTGPDSCLEAPDAG